MLQHVPGAGEHPALPGQLGVRLGFLAIPVLLLSRAPGFQLRWIWYLSVASVMVQAASNLLLLHSAFRRRLAFAPAPVAAHR